MILDSLTPEIV